jgi:hypothetical protein
LKPMQLRAIPGHRREEPKQIRPAFENRTARVGLQPPAIIPR